MFFVAVASILRPKPVGVAFFFLATFSLRFFSFYVGRMMRRYSFSMAYSFLLFFLLFTSRTSVKSTRHRWASSALLNYRPLTERHQQQQQNKIGKYLMPGKLFYLPSTADDNILDGRRKRASHSSVAPPKKER